MSADLLPPDVLKRKAVVYVRQSTQAQVQPTSRASVGNTTSSTKPGARVFGDVEVIDDDLGRSASGTVARPGFERLVAAAVRGRSRRRALLRRIPPRPQRPRLAPPA